MRQPVHVLYGGAHLFKAETPKKLASIALRAFEETVPTSSDLDNAFALNPTHSIHSKVANKLRTQAIEDLRIDFEDGYGLRSDDEEDGDAVRTAKELARAHREGVLPPAFGVRVKSLAPETKKRSIRTLELFVKTFCDELKKKLPAGFVITLPKVASAQEVSQFVALLARLEKKNKLRSGALRFEVMIELPSLFVNTKGYCELPAILRASRGRLIGAHFGAYDYLSACGISGSEQNLSHPLADFARHMMKNALADSGIFLADGATLTMPIGSREIVLSAWRESYRQIRRSLASGYYQGWDLHPAQIPIRYIALYSFFGENLPSSAKRMKGFLDKAAQASRVGTAFDDAASALGLLGFFRIGFESGALSEQDLAVAGLSPDDLAGSNQSFLKNRSRTKRSSG